MNKLQTFNKIVKDIKDIKIQGARNVAKYALIAYSLFPTRKSKDILLKTRPTEPMMEKVLKLAEQGVSLKKIFLHFKIVQEKINKSVFKLIRKNDKIFTHCHSSNVIQALIYTRKKGKNFEIYNTETRPLFQGRKTAKELKKAGIKVIMFIDSAIATAIEKENKKDRLFINKIFLGADAITKKGIINKIGSKTISELAKIHKIPIFIVADSWKFTKKKVPIEQRKLNEVWDNAPKKIKIQNPAFEFVDKKYITKIISEYGTLPFNDFLKKVKDL